MTRWRALGQTVAASLLFVSLMILGQRAGNATAEESSKILLQPTGNVVFRADWGGLLGLRKPHTAKAAVVIVDNDSEVSRIRFSGFYTNGDPLSDLKTTLLTGDGGSRAAVITFTTGDGRPTTGWLIVVDAAGKPRDSIGFIVQRVVTGSVLLKPVGGALVIPALLLILRHLSLRRKFSGAGALLRFDRLLEITDAKWSFKESWASNITAIGAGVGAVLSSKEFASEALGGLVVANFLGLTFLFGLLALLAPIAFGALFRSGRGTYAGLLASSFLTSAAAIGQLATVTIMIHRGGFSPAYGLVVTLLAWSILGTYVWRSVGDLVGVPAPPGSEAELRPMARASAIL